MKRVKRIILLIIITILLSLVTTHFAFKWIIEGYSIDPSIKNTLNKGQIIKLFITCLIYFLTLVTLPSLLIDIIRWIKLKEKDWWKAILALELFSLIFSYVATPPDLISTFLFFIICQPIVIVNWIFLKRELRKIDKKSGEINQKKNI